MNYTKGDIIRGYSLIKRIAIEHIKKKEYAKALIYFDAAADLASNLNWIFKDDEIENQLTLIGKSIIDQSKDLDIRNEKKIVFYDQIGNKTVLSLQYIRTLVNWNVEILYLIEPNGYFEASLIDELTQYKNIEIYILPEEQDERINNIQLIFDKIIQFSPSKVFFHSPAVGAFGVALWSTILNVTKYRITPGDHHFYLGVNITDFEIDYRGFGISTSIQKRGFKPQQIIFQPFYPIIHKSKFEGFPLFEVEDPIIIYTGGALYKTLGEDYFFYNKIIIELLKLNPRVVILFSGSEIDNYIINFINDYDLQKRFFFIGFRKDFIEIIKRTDIYLGTYPFFGGLMTQYAAEFKKPILQYLPDKHGIFEYEGIESFLNFNQKKEVKRLSFDDMDCFLSYANKLINDIKFRLKEGEEIFSYTLNKKEFDERLYNTIVRNKCNSIVPEIVIPQAYYLEKENWYLSIGNSNEYFKIFFNKMLGTNTPSKLKYNLIKIKRALKKYLYSWLERD